MAGNAFFSTRNLLAGAATVTVTNLDPTTPATNLCDGRLKTVIRADAADAVLTVEWDLGQVEAVRVLLAAEVNWPAGTTLRFCLSNTDADDEELLDVTVTPSLPSSRAQYLHYLPAALTARYGRIVVTTTGSTGVIPELGWLWLGAADFAPTVGMDLNARLGFTSRTLVQMTEGGTEYHDIRRGLWQWQFALRGLTYEEAFETALDIDADRDTARPVLFVPQWVDDSNDNLNRMALLGKFVSTDPVEAWQHQVAGKTYTLRECLAADETVAWA